MSKKSVDADRCNDYSKILLKKILFFKIISVRDIDFIIREISLIYYMWIQLRLEL